MKNRKLVLTERLAASATPAGKEYNLHDVTLRGFALRIQPSGAKSWIMRRRVNGSPKRITLGDARRLPLDQARTRAHAVLANGTTFEPGSNGSGPSFATFAEAYVTKRASHWKPPTRRTRDVYLRVTLLPFFADMRMDEIGTADVARWFHDYSAVRPGGANSALSILSDMFTRARDWGVLPATAPNPCKSIVRSRSSPRDVSSTPEICDTLVQRSIATPPDGRIKWMRSGSCCSRAAALARSSGCAGTR